jgi:UDP-2-acetamido-3-amino-2,3-dideoxy-glucuronate N-acetyltransferase
MIDFGSSLPHTYPSRFVGLIGLGYWGKNVLRNLYELGILHTACDCAKETIAAWKKEYSDLHYTHSYDEMLGTSDIKAIAISSPAETHYDFVKRAILAGKDVYVEKPLALTVAEGEDLVALAEKEDRILMVGHILQYHPAVIKLKELIDAGELGKIHYIYSNRLNIGKLRMEENILWSFAPHDISVILMLLGEEPVGVTGFGGAYLNDGVYDTTLTNLEFRNGIKSHIFVSWLHPFKEQKLVVVGSKAMAVFDDVSKEKLFFYPHRIEWKHGKIPVAQKAEHQIIPTDQAEPLKAELQHFADCVRQRKTPKTDGYEGLRVLKILDLAGASLRWKSDLSLQQSGTAEDPKLGSAAMQKPDEHSPCAPRTSLLAEKVFMHQSAYIDDGVEVGVGTKIWHFSHVLKGSKIGEQCIIGQNVCIGPDVTIGNRCKIQNNVSVYKGVVLEDEVFCGPSCVFTNVYNPRAFIERKHEFRPTVVKQGATIGANATIVCGATIGRYAMIGAGAVVKNDVPDYAVVAGVPAKQKAWACKCGTTLSKQDAGDQEPGDQRVKCSSCGNEYLKQQGSLVATREA